MHLLFSLLASATFSMEPRWCGSAEAASWAVNGLQRVLADPAPRASMTYGLPALPPDSAVHVTDEATCQRASRAYYRHELGRLPRGVAVVRVGNRYAVYGSHRAGEWTVMRVYSLWFEPVSLMLY